MIQKFLIIGMTSVILGCGGIDYRQTIQNVTEIAQRLCETSKDLDGLTPSEITEWCKVAENIFPFVELIIRNDPGSRILKNPYDPPKAGAKKEE